MKTANSTPSAARAWDEYDAYLFDIDGTLLECTDAVHYFAFCNALQLLAGRPLNLEGVTAHGNTDIGILRDALKLARVPEQLWRERLSETRAAMCRHVEEHKSELCTTVLPEVTVILDHLRSRGAVLGVATGNLEGIGKLKLQHCGLLSYFSFGGYSDAYEYRIDVFRGALDQARAAAGANARVCVVGDTPADVQAANANGLDVIAVATGIYPFARLAAEKPEWCLHSFRELSETLQPAAEESV
jgi:phosphoglycolate phosphatase-like HAD superfamily hydrolase